MITISEKERYLLKDLQDQEKTCIDKYAKYASEAKDNVLKDLFASLQAHEQKHYDSINQVLNGSVPAVDTNDNSGMLYNPTATYTGNYNQTDKDHDAFLCTDSIATEKYVSSAYNFQLFQFGSSEVRRLLNDIETEEQNHAEKLWRYKTVNQMC